MCFGMYLHTPKRALYILQKSPNMHLKELYTHFKEPSTRFEEPSKGVFNTSEANADG